MHRKSVASMVDLIAAKMISLTDRMFSEDQEAPSRLYHYTSQAGLIGIISSKALWATRIQYLNDSAEFGYTLELLKEAMRMRRDRFPIDDANSKVRRALQTIEEWFDSLSTIHIHVACFSEHGDKLNQWRGYCPQSGGYSIGFRNTQLMEATSRQRCFIAPCIYDVARQNELIGHLLDDFFAKILAEIFKRKEAGSDFKSIARDFVYDCVLLASVLKHPAFSEEHEWRIVTGELADNGPHMTVRQGRLVPIPYIGFELCQPAEILDVEVVVGPTPEARLALDSVRTLLQINKCVGSPKTSVIPYREI